MATDTTRTRLSAVAVKTETVEGQDAFAGTPALTDFIGAEATWSLPQQTVEDPTLTGSFDPNAPIPTGIRPQITIRMPLRGSGSATVAPEWGRLMRACRFEEVQQATSVGAPTAATAGTATTATLATPFAATAQAYRGMPTVLTGNPTGPQLTTMLDYTAGRVATFPMTFSPVLSTATLAQIPANWLYRVTDDETQFRPVTIYVYRGGQRWRLVGCKGSMSLEMVAGNPGFITFTMRGQLLGAYETVALPTGWNTISRPQAPIWANGLSRLDRVVARCARYTYNANVTMYDPENPEAPEGYDAPEITAANSSVTIDPFSSTTNSASRFGKFRVGTSMPFAGLMGSTVGNRIAVTNPSLRISAYDDANRGEMGVDNLTLVPDVPGQGMFLSVF
ncbi:hypothetical protein BKE38_05080 [Pseudoroseomonas deserti]|uniref:Uncharacterized protein n=1 Tax=Teichococcus deserti TaxID=1817963 RepID=A0A1V2H670_9PROT|nr:hypothetical protein [Pseudoroseomonas deserti]ONG56969.1 hypothetical protein BKE38_05080 [Pseudoroseomonas deserti]